MSKTSLEQSFSVGMAGYVFDQTGIRIWPFNSHHRVWANLSRVEFGLSNLGHGPMFRLQLYFGDTARKPLDIRRRRGVKNLQKIAQIFRLAQAARPEAEGWQQTEIVEALKMAEWEDSTVQPGDLTDEELLNRGRLRMAALLFKPAIADFGALIERSGAGDAEAAERKIIVELAKGDADSALLTLQGLLRKHPENLACRVRVAIYLLLSNDERGAQLADGVLPQAVAGFPALVLYYAGYLVRQKKLEAAQQLLTDFPINRAKLTSEEKAKVDKFQTEISELRANPQRAFKELVVQPKLRWLRTWGFLLLIAALFVFTLYQFGPLLAREEWHLGQLRGHGAKADLVEGVRFKDALNSDVFISDMFYLYAPDKTKAAPLVPQLPADSREIGSAKYQEAMDAFEKSINDTLAGKLPPGWYGGHAIVFKDSAKEIMADPKEQFVTYLPEDPTISTIGPITRNRVWFTWVGGGKGVIMAAFFLLYLPTHILYLYLKRRAKRRKLLVLQHH